MNESTKTKKALRGSLFALFLCIVLLIGTTFAWFTDTASTGVNKIQAGNLKVDIVDATNTAKSLKGDTLKFTDVNNSTDILWEPGVTFNTPAFKIKNAGNLALKYKLTLNGVTGDQELLDAITFSVVDENGKAVNLDTFEGKLAKEGMSGALYIPAHIGRYTPAAGCDAGACPTDVGPFLAAVEGDGHVLQLVRPGQQSGFDQLIFGGLHLFPCQITASGGRGIVAREAAVFRGGVWLVHSG